MSTPNATLDPGHVRLRSVSKRYRQRGTGTRRTDTDTFAVHDVSFDVAPGEMLGLVGVNGSGKSTLLRLAAGVAAPTSGTVEVAGRIAGILSLGDGFHTLLTGRENAMTAAILAGMSRQEAAARLPEVIEFSELGSAIDDPVRTYSAGMFVRLAYAVAAHVDADVLLVDEALAVGDLAFATKCLDHLDTLRQRGTTILLASHDIDMVRSTCDRVAWIDRSVLRDLGPPAKVVEEYRQSSHVATREMTPPDRAEAGRFGSGDVEVTAAVLRNSDGTPTTTVSAGAGVTIDITMQAMMTNVGAALVSVSVHDSAGETLVDLSHAILVPESEKEFSTELTIERLDLAAGDYSIAVGVHAPEFLHAFDYLWEATRFSVVGQSGGTAYLPPHRWRAR